MSNVSQKPMITTIIPTYRRPKLLRRAIRSVLNQTYPHFQVCVYDNASGDETASVVAEMASTDPRVKYHCHAENVGAAKNFIYGMEHVETPFFSFLSDDDLVLPKFYETALAGFDKHPEAIFSATMTISPDDQGNILPPPSGIARTPVFFQPPEGLLAILKYHVPIWTGILFRKDVIEKVGILDPELEMNSDLDYTLRAARFPFVISKEPCAIYVPRTKTHSDTWARFHSILPYWIKMTRKLTEDEQIPLYVRIHAEQMLTEFMKKWIFLMGIGFIMRKNFLDAYDAAEILRNYYHLKTKPFFLSTAAKVCNCFPPVYYLSVFLNGIRKFVRRNKHRHLQKKFEDYKRFLEL